MIAHTYFNILILPLITEDGISCADHEIRHDKEQAPRANLILGANGTHLSRVDEGRKTHHSTLLKSYKNSGRLAL